MPTTLIAAAFFGGDLILMGAALGSVGVAAASFAVTFVVSSLVTQAFASGEQTGSAGSSIDKGVRQQNPPATSNSVPIVYGDAYLGGTFVDAVLSVDQQQMYYVLAISSIVQSASTFQFDLTKMYYGDRTITFDATDQTKVNSLTDGAGNVDTKVAGNLFIYFYTSDYSGVITPYNGGPSPTTLMSGSDIAAGQRWASTNRQMNGLAFAIVKLTYNRDAETTSMMPITFKVSQYLNGAGAAYPGAVWLDYMKSTVYGAAMPADLVDAASATALDSYSQATITFTNSAGGAATQPRYKINGVIDTGQNTLANISRIMTACDSWNQYNEASGKWAVVINEAVASTFAFDDTNIIGEIKTSLLDLSSSINQIEAQFPSKLNRDQTDVVYLQTPGGLLYANEPVNKYSCAYDLVNDSVQASYLANRTLEQAREDLTVTISAAYPAIQVDAGDVVSLTNVAYGWSNKLFRAMKVSEICLPDGNLGATLDLNEYNAAVYDNADITQYSPAPNSNLSSANFFSAIVAPVISNSYPANDIPSFDVRVTTPTIGRVTTLELYYATVATPTTSQWTRFDTYTAPAGTALTGGNDFTFRNEMLPAGTYYFGFVAGNDTGQSQISGASAAFVWAPTGTTGTQTAIVFLYQWLASAPGDPSGTSTYTWATATNSAYTGGNGWLVTIPANPGTAGYSLWQAAISISAPATDVTTSVSWATGFSKVAISTNGSNGTRTAIMDVYQSAATAPTTFPVGTSTYTWATGQFTAPATLNGWSLTPPAAVLGQTLWIARTVYADNLTAATTSITWAATAALSTSVSGVNGTRTAFLEVYLWAATTPTVFPSGTSTYTWATGAFTAPTTPAGWSITPGASTAGYTLYGCAVSYADSLTTSTSSVTWSTSTAYAVGAAGTNGVSAVRAYALYAGNPTVTGAAVTKSGTTLPATTDFSPTSATAFTTNTQTPGSSQAMFQSDGLYYPVTNQTIWNTPYLSNLKVGNLSAITADLGTITAGDLSIGSSPAVSGTTMTGTGSHLYSDGRFAMGKSTQNFVYNGTDVFLNGFTTATQTAGGTININNTTYTTAFTFTVVKAGNVLAFTSTNATATTNLAIANGGIFMYIITALIDSSSAVVTSTVCQYNHQPVFDGTNYSTKEPVSSVLTASLAVGTYTLGFKGYAAYSNSAGTGLATNQPIQLTGNYGAYQATI